MRLLLAVLLVAGVTACGDADDSSSASTAVAAVTAVTTTTAPTAASTTPLTTVPTTTSPATTSPATIAPTTPALADSPTTVPASTAPPTTAPAVATPEGFGEVAATATAADGTVCELCLWLADSGELRSQGLMYVTDLGDADGMVFRYEQPTTAAFWMKNTVMPLSIAFYDATGAYLDAFDMEPCTTPQCPTYPTPEGFVSAIEVPQGGLAERGLVPGSVLVVSDLPCED